MEISWTEDKKLKIVSDVDTFKKIQDGVDFNQSYDISNQINDFISADFDPSQIDLEQSIHPGVNKDYDVKLNGYDLELISHVDETGKTAFTNGAFERLVEKLRKQVPYQF